ncbi:hypothetical protein D3C76_1049510 [compost metagenome]
MFFFGLQCHDMDVLPRHRRRDIYAVRMMLVAVDRQIVEAVLVFILGYLHLFNRLIGLVFLDLRDDVAVLHELLQIEPAWILLEPVLVDRLEYLVGIDLHESLCIQPRICERLLLKLDD